MSVRHFVSLREGAWPNGSGHPPKDTTASDPATMGVARIFAAWRGGGVLYLDSNTDDIFSRHDTYYTHKLPKFNTAPSPPNKTNQNVTSRPLDTYNTKRG